MQKFLLEALSDGLLIAFSRCNARAILLVSIKGKTFASFQKKIINKGLVFNHAIPLVL
jgi:hypothetical protein